MWQEKSKSLRLSRYLLILAMIVWVGALPVMWWLWKIAKGYVIVYLLNFLPIFLIFSAMLKFLANIAKGDIFCADNVELLRKVSWYCLYSSVFCLVFSLYQPIFIVCSGVVGFYGLLMRVVKNMLSEANCIKEENEYTI